MTPKANRKHVATSLSAESESSTSLSYHQYNSSPTIPPSRLTLRMPDPISRMHTTLSLPDMVYSTGRLKSPPVLPSFSCSGSTTFGYNLKYESFNTTGENTADKHSLTSTKHTPQVSIFGPGWNLTLPRSSRRLKEPLHSLAFI